MAKIPPSRRTLLKGALAGIGVQVALPLFEYALNPNGTAFAQGQVLPKRFVQWFYGLGVLLNRWVPSTTGAGWALSEQLMPLSAVKEYVNVVSGTSIKFYNESHHTGGICFRTGKDRGDDKAGEQSTVKGPSLDQIVAAALGGTTRFRSLQLGVLRANQKGEGDGVLYSSHNGPDSPNPPELDPAAVFNRVFGAGFSPPTTSGTPPVTPAPVDLTLTLRKSVLDAVLADIDTLKPRLGASDIARLDQHATNIREIEKRLVPATGAPAAGPGCSLPPTPMSYGSVVGVDAYAAVNKLMSDLTVMALACDQTRVVAYQYSGVGNYDSYEGITGNKGEHHQLGHDGDNESVHKITVFIMQQLAYLLGALKATPEGAGNLLDQTGLVALTEIAEGQSHEISNMPLLIAGKLGGALKYPGVHAAAPNALSTVPILSVLRGTGLTLPSFGEGVMQADKGLSEVEA